MITQSPFTRRALAAQLPSKEITLVRRPAEPFSAGALRGEQSKFEGEWIVRAQPRRLLESVD